MCPGPSTGNMLLGAISLVLPTRNVWSAFDSQGIIADSGEVSGPQITLSLAEPDLESGATIPSHVNRPNVRRASEAQERALGSFGPRKAALMFEQTEG